MKNMKKNFVLLLSVFAVCFGIHAQNKAVFDFFEYRGNDKIFQSKINTSKQYRNPILAGFYPDPSICRKADTFYLVNSSFAFYPGIPIFTSNDLVNWTQIGHVLDRPSQLNLDNLNIREGIYAPAISYNKFNDTFYLITTSAYGINNFIVKTKDPAKGWSDPIVLPEVNGIDPSLFFDEDGKAYIVNNDAPQGTPEYEGHRAIWIHEFNVETDQTFGTPKVIVDGGVDKSKKPIWIEGPHVYKRNGKYLLICAEGGTSTNHSEVAFLSDHVFGPYIPYKNNPILTQRDLPEDRKNKISSVGHADIVDDADGKTWAVFLGARPYEGDNYNTGRETFMLPVAWKNNIPLILPKGKALPLTVKKQNSVLQSHTGNFTWRDEFINPVLKPEWLMIRTPRSEWFKIDNGELSIQTINASIYKIGQPAFLGRRQQHTDFSAVTSLKFHPAASNELAGLVCFQNEKFNFVFGKTIVNGKPALVLDRTAGETKRIVAIEIPNEYKNNTIQLKVIGKGATYSFYVAYENNYWHAVADNVDARNLSTNVAGGFSGTILGLYATSGNDSLQTK